MKKFLSMILLMSMLLSVHAVLAEADFDFSACSYDELIHIREQLEAELGTRPESGERILQAGRYLVGKDIVPGVYDLSFVAAEEDDTYSNWYIYDTKQMYDYDVSRLFLGDLPRDQGTVRAGGSVKIDLFDGDYFVIYRSAVSILRSGNVVPVESGYTPPEGTSIPTGIYIVGEEIPAGKYTVYYNGETPSRVRTYVDPEDASSSFSDADFEAILAPYNTSIEINLKEGYAFRLEYNNVVMKKSEGFVFD